MEKIDTEGIKPKLGCIILDGDVIVRMLRPKQCKTFKDYGTLMFLPHLKSWLRKTRFPVDKEEKRKWLINMLMGNWEPSHYSKICSNHFKESDINRTGCRVTLKHSAVPTRFSLFPSHVKKATKNAGYLLQDLWLIRAQMKDQWLKSLVLSLSIMPKVTSLKDLAKNLKQQNQISRCCEDILAAKLSGISLEFLKRMMAYEIVRKDVNLALPLQSHIRKWYSKIPAEPDFTKPAFTALSQKVEEGARNGRKVICSLILDEMAMRKHISWDGERYCGYVDIGNGNDDDSFPVAKDVLVFMVVAVNNSWKVPCPYFFINGLTGSERANLVMLCIKKLHEVGVSVISLTCDGPSCHFTMMTEIGANVDHELQTFFPNPVDSNQRVYVIFHVSHMVKLVRNTLGIKSIRGIFAEHVEPLGAPLKYLLTQKLSKDHINLFFGAVCSAGGFNNNPTVEQFTSQLLLRSSIGGGKRNGQRQYPTAILHVLDDVCNVDDSTSAISHMADYAAKMVESGTICRRCCEALGSVKSIPTSKFMKEKDKDCKGIRNAIAASVLEDINISCIFRELDDHMFDTMVNDNHIFALIKKISNAYCKIKL
eukprot:gene1993-2263_t